MESQCSSIMPPYILPKTLFEISLDYVQVLISFSCRNIAKWYGEYNSNECQDQISSLQKYLSNIPGMVLDEVFDKWTTSDYPFEDARIALAVYTRCSMRKFSFGKKTDSLKSHLDNNAFWIENVSTLRNLVILDLHHICTDEILEIVGSYCHKLEQINIVSRTEPFYVKDHITQETFNALKVKFFVSDVGLGYLSNCKLLKRITMNKMIRSQYGGRMMTVVGIRNLVKSLPFLQSLSYDDMGLVISEDMDDVQQLPLTHLRDCHPKPSHITAASNLCSNLQHLHLQLPINSITYEATDILDSLRRSNLTVSILELVQFPLCAEFAHLLRIKGQYLRSLLIQTTDCVSSRVVHIIGQTCQNLKNLHLRNVEGTSDNRSSNLEQIELSHVECMFKDLRCLYVEGRDWNPALLLLCLNYAKQLETLSIKDTTQGSPIDDVISNIISLNPLKEVKTVDFFTRRIFFLSTIHYFFKHCPKLTDFSFIQNVNITDADVLKMIVEIQENNLDLKIRAWSG